MKLLILIGILTVASIGCGPKYEVREDSAGNLVRVNLTSGDVEIVATAAPVVISTPPTPAPRPPELALATMKGMRAIGTAMEQFAIDEERYPIGNSVAEVKDSLSPTYIRSVDKYSVDGWGNPLLFESDGTDYVIRSLGADSSPDAGGEPLGRTSNWSVDIVYQNGEFTQWPADA